MFHTLIRIADISSPLAGDTKAEVSIVFVDAAKKPSKNEPWEQCAALILNPCDGYHHVFARWDGEGEFDGFYDFAGTDPYTEKFYVAWALLPDELPLIYLFDPKRAPTGALWCDYCGEGTVVGMCRAKGEGDFCPHGFTKPPATANQSGEDREAFVSPRKSEDE